MTYTVASFFSGIGGIDLAFAWAGFDIRFQCEIDEYCQQVLKKWRPVYWQNAVIKGDIKNVSKREVGKVDVIVGGFPCQDISIAGKRAGIKHGNRSGLWFELLRVIREVRPQVILLENVSAISVPVDGTAPGLVVIGTLAEIGYDCAWQFIRASDVGAPHQRERWFCIGYDVGDPERKRRIRHGENRKRYLSKRPRQALSKVTGESGNVGKPCVTRLEGHRKSRIITSRPDRRQRRYVRAGTKSRLGRVTHGVSRRVDRHNIQYPARPNEPQYDYEPPRVTDRKENRVSRIKALGNAVVPQQVYPFAEAIRDYLKAVS